MKWLIALGKARNQLKCLQVRKTSDKSKGERIIRDDKVDDTKWERKSLTWRAIVRCNKWNSRCIIVLYERELCCSVCEGKFARQKENARSFLTNSTNVDHERYRLFHTSLWANRGTLSALHRCITLANDGNNRLVATYPSSSNCCLLKPDFRFKSLSLPVVFAPDSFSMSLQVRWASC